MRLIRCAAALAATLTLSAVSTAEGQGPRPFRDSWFWGGFGGLTSFTPVNAIDPAATGPSTMAAQVGGDWLITRKTGGLYLGFAQAFLTGQGAVPFGPSSADTGYRFVDVKNLRRVNLAAMLYPGTYVRLHPYFGFGVAFDYLGAVRPVFEDTDTPKQEEFVLASVSEVKAALGPLFIAGAQYRALNEISVFGQMTAAAMSKEFLLSNGRPISIGFQVGVRYNLGSSVDRGY